MSLRLDYLGVAAPLALLAVATGCNNQGHSGDACEADASALYPVYTCNAELVCNTGLATPTCESPNAQGSNGPCGDDDNCQAGLYCAVSRTCEAVLSAGEPCPDETGCGPGLVCVNAPTPVCVGSDASLGSFDATVDSSSGGDASLGDAGGDGSDGSEANEASDSSSAGDASCGPSGDAGDAGEHAGACPSGGMCCSGGAVGTFYCYTGESGTCPAVP